MKVGEEYIVHRFGSNACTSKAVKIGFLEVVENRHGRPVFIVASPGVDQDGVARCFYKPAVETQENVAFRLTEHARSGPLRMLLPHIWIKARKESARGETFENGFSDLRDLRVADLIAHQCFSAQYRIPVNISSSKRIVGGELLAAPGALQATPLQAYKQDAYATSGDVTL